VSTTNSRLIATPTHAQRHPAYFADLYEKSRAQEFGLGFDEFALILNKVSCAYLPSGASEADIAQLHRSLRLEDLALARACAHGSEVAWDCFLNRYRQKLYDAAAGITKEESAARELADSLYAELFGTRQTEDGQRISKLTSYTGRGSLEGWLRTVLAQNYINQYRTRRRLVSFDEQADTGEQSRNKQVGSEIFADSRLEQATDAALGELSTEERMILASYYLDERTLAEIGRMLRVHESTISRRIEKITARLHKQIVRGLRKRGMSARAAEEAMESDVRDLRVDLRTRLRQEKIGARKE
jgi:RNA polymerase sigma-70 factor (ECF subfamily)